MRLPAKRVLVWCERCNTKVWIRGRSVNDVLLEALWHRLGYCLLKSKKKKLEKYLELRQ
jgi:hypothetical protein